MFRTTLGLILNLVAVVAFAQDVGTFSGRVLSSAGIPVEGATLTFPGFDPGHPLGESKTDGEGNFKLVIKEPDGVSIQRHSDVLTVEAAGFAATYVDKRQLTLFPGGNKNLGDIVLDIGRSYSGKVINQMGEPIAGAIVRCGAYRHDLSQTVNYIGREATVTTDSTGCFQTPQLPLGDPSVFVQAPGYLNGFYERNDFANVDEKGQLPELLLKSDKPIHGVVKNDLGEPVANANVRANEVTTITDAAGNFVLGGFGENANVQLQIAVDGYVFVNWEVKAVPDGFKYYDIQEAIVDNGDPEAYAKAREKMSVLVPRLEIVLQREAQIRGRVIDAETDAPIDISRIVLCSVTRKPDGEVVIDGCRDSRFSQPNPGEFLLGYAYPGEYHLTVSAEGFDDAEGFTPLVETLQQIDDIVIKMKKRGSSAEGESMQRQQIKGVFRDQGELSEGARVALWKLPGHQAAANAYVIRGRTTAGDGFVFASAMLEGGRFSLDVPYQDNDWYVLVETPKRVIAFEGPITIAKGESKTLDLGPQNSGGLRGILSNHSAVSASLHAILFSDAGIQYETRVQANGSFEFTDVYPGVYGLKVGCDSILDSEIPGVTNTKMTNDELRMRSDPWKRAMRVTVREGEVLDSIEIAFEQ